MFPLSFLGHYLYIESSSPRRNLDKAILISPVIPAGQACLKFYYHMNGKDIGKLKLKLFSNNSYVKGTPWRKRGNQGNQWKEAKISISINRPYQVYTLHLEETARRNVAFAIKSY